MFVFESVQAAEQRSRYVGRRTESIFRKRAWAQYSRIGRTNNLYNFIAVSNLNPSLLKPNLLIVDTLVEALSIAFLKCVEKILDRFFVAIVIPKYLYEETISNTLPLSANTFFESVLFKIRTLHLDVLNSILLTLDHLKAMFIRFCRLQGLSEIRTISSAKPSAAICKLPTVAPNPEFCKLSNRSLMNIRKSKGPSLLPCKTPLFISNSRERYPLMRTLARLEENKS